ncbi:MAG: TIM barrel protein, partial [Planctomycetes bacterium]|nr:TIM barrel protein [Planctomycetota bacterium]
MSTSLTRRDLLAGAAVGVALLGGQAAAGPATRPTASRPTIRKALGLDMLPTSLALPDRFMLAADLGFEGVEVATIDDDNEVEAMRSAADRAGIVIHSVMDALSWQFPLSSDDPAVVDQGLDILRRSIRNAKDLGGDNVLLVPGVVTPQVRYQQVWERSQREIRKVLPFAAKLGVVIAIENVGNRFLLSPLEFARYVDEFRDPFLRAYFDVGNSVILWSYPQDWLLTLGRRVHRIHLKDCDFARKRFVR